jgi:hypothetical protein
MEGLVNLSDAEHAALASLTDKEANELFTREGGLPTRLSRPQLRMTRTPT